jgi:molybdenum cofactor biosynthesis protein B
MSHAEHEDQARSIAVGCAVITVSDTRTEATDTGGRTIIRALEGEGHTVADYRIVPDERAAIAAAVARAAERADVQAILLTGGTGIAARDCTPEAVEPLFEQRLDGFGELFRMLSYQEIGAGALLSRATAGIYQRRLVIAMPGSTKAVALAMNALVLPQVRHLVWELSRPQPGRAAPSEP